MAKGFIFRIGGAAGDGGTSTAENFARICVRSGLYTFTYTSYQSVIRGGHVWVQVRAEEDPVLSQGERPNLLVALNQQTADIHANQVRDGGAILLDEGLSLEAAKLAKNVRILRMPLVKTATELGVQQLKNVVAVSAAMALLSMDEKLLEEAIRETWGTRKPKALEGNLEAMRRGTAWVAANGGSLKLGVRFSGKRRLLMTGNTAIALGAVAAGCNFFSQYPMTPASSIMHWVAAHAGQCGVVMKQAEDELAAINMCIGAAHAGTRAMTATSGGGFCLMVEALGEAGMTETPVVVALVARCGPSTGLPTKTEQGDLNLVLGAGQGDWPRIILAPRNTAECFYETARAFNLADIYQTPVILLSDLYLSEGFRTLEPDALDMNVPIVRGYLADGQPPEGGYKRFQITDSGVSPRAVPGMKGFQYVAGTDEHTEDGELISDVLAGVPEFVEVRRKMHEKRMRKLRTAVKDMEGPEVWPEPDAEYTILSWGSSQGPVREAVLRLRAEGASVNSMEFRDLFPMPVPLVEKVLAKVRTSLLVEGNFTGQFGRLLRAETGFRPDFTFFKSDGEPFSPDEIAAKVKEVLVRA